MTDALKLAALLDADPTHSEVSEQSAAMLRQQHAALESLRLEYQRLMDKHNALHVNAAKSRAEVESLRAGRVPEGFAVVLVDRSYDQRAKAIIAHNQCTGDLDDKLNAA